MAIGPRPDGHLRSPADAFHQAAPGLRSDRLVECVELVRAHGLRGVFVRVPEFTGRDVDVLEGLPDLEEGQLHDIDLADLQGLYRPRLLRLFGKRPPIDFGYLRTPSRLIVEHRPRDRGFDPLDSLTPMRSWRFKPAQVETFDLALPAGLETLMIVGSPVGTIVSLGSLPNLRDLDLAELALVSTGRSRLALETWVHAGARADA